MQKKIKVRLYKKYDYDLYVMYMTLGARPCARIFREILENYAAGSNSVFAFTIKDTLSASQREKDIIVMNVTINSIAAATMLNNVTDNLAPTFIKNIVRASLVDNLAPLYFQKDMLLPQIKQVKTMPYNPVPNVSCSHDTDLLNKILDYLTHDHVKNDKPVKHNTTEAPIVMPVKQVINDPVIANPIPVAQSESKSANPDISDTDTKQLPEDDGLQSLSSLFGQIKVD